MGQAFLLKEPVRMEVSEVVLMRYKYFENLVELMTNMKHKRVEMTEGDFLVYLELYVHQGWDNCSWLLDPTF